MTGDREPDLPEALRAALAAAPDAAAAFETLPPSHRREYAAWVGEAKRPETGRRRAARAVEMIRDGARPA